MDVLAVIGATGRLLLGVLAVIAPLLIWQWTIVLARSYRGRPGPAGLTVAASVMVGIAALAALIPGSILTWDAIAARGGFWELSLREFLSVSVGIARQAIPALQATLQFDDQRRNFQAWLAAAFALWLVRMVLGLVAGPPRGVRRFLLAELVCFVVGVFATIYAGPLLLWSINRLNFWIFLVLILLIQDCRYDEPPLILRLAARPIRMFHQHHALPSALS